LSDAERASLEALSRKRTASQALAERARVVLACGDEGGVAPLTRVAARTGLSRESVRKWRVRFMQRRLDGLGDAPRPGAARKITDEQVEVLVTRTLTEKGRGQDSHWSTRAMAAETGLSQSSVSRIWRAFGLKPHIVETWKLSADPEFIGKVRDVVYMSPPENALVLCVDEKSQIQAPDRTTPCLPMLPTTPGPDDARLRPARHDQPVRGARRGQRLDHRPALPTPPPSGVPAVPQAHRRRRPEGLRATPGAGQLRHAQDPGDPPVAAEAPAFHLHFTPTSSSWMNLVERWFAELTNRKLRRSAHRSVAELETDIRKWTSEWNKNPRPFAWTKTADEILETLAAYCQRLTGGD
jgi:transposase